MGTSVSGTNFCPITYTLQRAALSGIDFVRPGIRFAATDCIILQTDGSITWITCLR